MNRLHVGVLKAHEATTAKNADADTGYDPDRPWNAVFRAVLHDRDWWDKEVSRPGLQISARIRTLSSCIGGDAPTSHSTAPHALAHAPALPPLLLWFLGTVSTANQEPPLTVKGLVCVVPFSRVAVPKPVRIMLAHTPPP